MTESAWAPRREPVRISVGNGPTAVAYVAGAFPLLWVANSLDDTVTIVNALKGETVRRIATGVDPVAVAVDTDRVGWIANRGSASVTRFDLDHPTTERIDVGAEPSAVLVAGRFVWVADSGDGTVSRIEQSNWNGSPQRIDVGGRPDSLAFGAGSVWVAGASDHFIVRLDVSTGDVEDRIPVGFDVTGLAFANGRLMIGARAGGDQHRGGTLRIASAEPSPVLDPALADDAPSRQLLAMTNDGLVAFRRAPGAQGSVAVPDLATSLPTPSDAGETYTFHVRDGVEYSDGRKVTALDFRTAIERTLRRDGPAAALYRGIKGARGVHSGGVQPVHRHQGRRRRVDGHVQAHRTRSGVSVQARAPGGGRGSRRRRGGARPRDRAVRDRRGDGRRHRPRAQRALPRVVGRGSAGRLPGPDHVAARPGTPGRARRRTAAGGHRAHRRAGLPQPAGTTSPRSRPVASTCTRPTRSGTSS